MSLYPVATLGRSLRPGVAKAKHPDPALAPALSVGAGLRAAMIERASAMLAERVSGT